MSNDNPLMRQCKLEYVKDKTTETAWIPAEIAIQDKRIRVKNDDDAWEICYVREAYPVTKDWKYINERSRDHTKTRDASDI
jgi:hypothetical protein